MTRLAQAIAKMEGFGIAGDLPTRQNNPGDLRHAPGELHAGDLNAVGSFVTPAEGWAALERQLKLYAERGLTIEQAITRFAPPFENDTDNYLADICKLVPCQPDDLVEKVLQL